MMGKEKIAITLDEEFIGELDRLVRDMFFKAAARLFEKRLAKSCCD